MPIDYKKLYQNHDIILTNANPDDLVADGTLESTDVLQNYFKKKDRFIPPVDFSDLNNFARFGSAEKYYVDAIDRVYKTYPYDGSIKERLQWELSSSYFDLYVFDQVYPRTNGHVILSADGWGTQIADSEGYGAPATASYEYIFIKGGPHTSNRSKAKNINDTTGDYKSGYANIWEPAKNRECNLKIGGIDGNTVEFWMKKSEFVNTKTSNEVIFDAHTSGHSSSSLDYGRMTIEMATTVSDSPFRVTYMSGTSGVSYATVGASITTSSVADGNWHHYAFTLKNAGSDLEVNFYVDGACNETVVTGSSINYVSGNINATIGSLATSPSGTSNPTLGWGKLSGSLDEFRYWKADRSSAEVLRYMIEPVGGGTNTDDANTNLGVYYKFNEGVVGNSTYDKNVLDYSGRISNGTFVGYNSSARDINSAMVGSGLVDGEFKDPILYSFHPDVASTRETKKQEGIIYDYANNSSIYYTLPAWITEEDEDKEYSPLKNLTQVVGSYFDSLAESVKSIPALKHKTYLGPSHKPYPFSDRILQSLGFTYFPELFSDATALEYFKNRNDRSLYEKKLYDVKNRIYQNIYNNIIYINKSKGTEKSFRNLLHCFGLGEEIYRINTYGNRVTYTLKDNFKSIAEFKKYVNFTLTGSSEATIFPHSSSTNSNSKAIISSSYGLTSYLGFTMESEVQFPIRHTLADSNTVAKTDEGPSRQFRTYVPLVTASLFGVHQTELDATGNDLTWASSDYANFQVFAVKASDYSKRVNFVLTGTSDSVIGPLELESGFVDEVYDDTRWTFSVSVKPNSKADLIDGSSGSIDGDGYTVEFYGVEKIVDIVKNEFYKTGTLSGEDGIKFLNYPKAPYIGAHRTNFSGTLQEKADGNISSTRVWYAHFPTGTIQQHHMDVKNYGTDHPFRSAYLYPTSLTGVKIPTIDTLVLNWTFDTVTGSDSSGEFIGADFSSGSASKVSRYGDFGEIVGKQYLPKGYNFPANSSLPINRKYVNSAKKQLPEMINSSDMVNILTDDDKYFNKSDLLRPTNYYTSIEKSMYQTISDEMVRMFSSIKDFNNLIGEPVNKYRDDYKDMAKLRQLFYERVGNTPDLDKYIDFYKWVDITLDTFLGYLIPASADMSDQYGSNIRTMVENTTLQRNKYKWQYPTLEDKTPDIEGNILGINELLYDWEFGHAPTDYSKPPELQTCLWWEERAKRANYLLTSGDNNVDSDKQAILDSIINETNASAPTLGSYDSDSGDISSYEGSTYVTRRLAKPLRLKVDKSPVYKQSPSMYENKNIGFFDAVNEFAGGAEYGTIQVEPSFLEGFKDCDNNLALNQGKRKYNFKAYGDSDLYKGAKIFPFNLYSASIGGGVNDTISSSFMPIVDITNLHMDVYGPDYEVPMQTPFTEKFVGGRAYRHIFSNFTPDNNPPDQPSDRIEGWVLDVSSSLSLRNADYGRASLFRSQFFRDEYVKRPVNIRNIQMFTGSSDEDAEPEWHGGSGRPDQALGVTNIGNYTDNYELVMTNDRSINNRYLAEAPDGLPTTYTESTAVSGVVDFTLPRRDLTGSTKSIIVNRFSAPGDPATMGEGMLDVAAAEYSVYNSLPWRNLSVRQPLNEWYTDHNEQFGYFSDAQTVADYELAGETYPGGNSEATSSDYSGTGSFHKINRNTRRVIRFSGSSTGSYVDDEVYDNWFVQHQIPQTDLQYAWITASVVNDYDGPALYGYEQPDYSNASLASTDITFVSASNTLTFYSFGRRGPYFDALYTLFSGLSSVVNEVAGLNRNIYEPITPTSNTLGYPMGSTIENYFNPTTGTMPVAPWSSLFIDDAKMHHLLFMKRNSIYGWPSWKQTRGAQHPVMRYNYKNNLQTFEKIVTTNTSDGYIGHYKTVVSQSEPPITSKFKPLEYSIKFNTDGPFSYIGTGMDPNSVKMWTSYGNEMAYFTNIPDSNISGLIDLNNSPELLFTKTGQINRPLQEASDKILAYDTLQKYLLKDSPSYIHGVANPIDKFHYLDITETIFPREHYTYKSIVRGRENFENNFWRDTRHDRDTALETSRPNSQGYSVSQSIWPLDGRSDMSLPPQTGAYGIEGELQNGYSLFFDTDPVPAATYNRRIPESGSDGITYAGDLNWQAGVNVESASSDNNPFYDSYDVFAEDVRAISKNYGIVPEYRISEHLEYHLVDMASSGGYYAEDPSWLTLSGAAVSSSDDPSFYTIYTNSDFLKHFEPIYDDYSGIAMTTKLTLKCSALTKLLPYDGFYPMDRAVQLAQLFSQSLGPNTTLEGTNSNWRTALTPLFAPGILFNSIKSGLAVDYPYNNSTSGISITGSSAGSPDEGDARLLGSYAFRLPFEALVDPKYHLNGRKFIDFEPHSDSFIDSTASFSTPSNSLYEYAINNFMAEVPRFFLGGTDGTKGNEYGPLSSLVSVLTEEGTTPSIIGGEEGSFIYFEPDKTYKMRIVCSHSKRRNLYDIKNDTMRAENSASFIYNAPTLMMYNRAFNLSNTSEYEDRFVGEKQKTSVYGSSFGPPSDASYGSTKESSFEPFTPPYYNGYSHLEVTYTPDIGGYKTISDVIGDVEVSYYREGLRSGSMHSSSMATSNAMGLGASINWRQMVTANGKTQWVIQPKWECPILDFKRSSIDLPDTGSGSVAKGMWHLNGVLPEANSGVYLEVQKISDEEKASDSSLAEVEDLADKLGFIGNNGSTRLGLIPEGGKTIYEAIVALPFYENFNGKRTFFHISRKTINWAMAKLQDTYTTDAEYLAKKPDLTDGDMIFKPAPSVVNMVKNMTKYSLPPSFNFLLKTDQEPFAMTFFEFSQHLTQDDLVKIWQGIMPHESRKDASSGVQCAISEIDIGINLLSGREQLDATEPEYKAGVPYKGWDILNNRPGELSSFPKNIQWMIFKVKQRAHADYYSLTADKSDAIGKPIINSVWNSSMGFFQFYVNPFVSFVQKMNSIYRHNWPYDFCSIIETAKIDETVTLEPRKNFKLTSGPKLEDMLDAIPVLLGPEAATILDSVTKIPSLDLPLWKPPDIQLPPFLKNPEWLPELFGNMGTSFTEALASLANAQASQFTGILNIMAGGEDETSQYDAVAAAAAAAGDRFAGTAIDADAVKNLQDARGFIDVAGTTTKAKGIIAGEKEKLDLVGGGQGGNLDKYKP